MNRKIIVQSITLLSFFSLVALFVAVRSGRFSQEGLYNFGSSNSSALVPQKMDTLSTHDSLKRAVMMSSSKSIIIRENLKQSTMNKKVKKDSLIPVFQTDSIETDSITHSSSFEQIAIDTILNESSKK